MHVRMSPKPHIFANFDGDWPYWSDRVEFTNKNEKIFQDDPEPTDAPPPNDILGVPLGVYRRCTPELVSRLESRVSEMHLDEDVAGAVRGSDLCAAVSKHVDDQ